MLSRYRIVRGARPPEDPLPEGIRNDTRFKTRHCLRPREDIVETYLQDPSDDAWEVFAGSYRALLERRHAEDATPFLELAELARTHAVHLGCSCPTRKNPDVNRCHTVLALQFMKDRFPDLDVVFPG